MRTSVVFLATALCLVLPYCNARPGEISVKKQSAQTASTSASSSDSESEVVVKKGGCGCGRSCGCGKGASYVASKKRSSQAASASASSASSSYEARSSDACTELTEAEIKVKYAQLKGESLVDYYKRIVRRDYAWTKSTTAWLKTMSILRKDFCDLDLWYNTQYLDLTKDFYISYYARQDSESEESYYSRIFKKEAWESEDLFARRITVIRDCFPRLDLWSSEKWFNKYTRSLYALEFKKFAKESDADYVKRIFARDQYFDTTDEIWAKRVFWIQEATINSCSLWYSKDYISYLNSFYSIYYRKLDSDTCDGWLLRALTPLPGESPENAIRRINMIKEVTGDCGCWKIDYFKKIQQAKSLQSEWLSLVQKSFFPCGCGGVSVAKKSSKKSVSASASASSESSKSSKVVSV